MDDRCPWAATDPLLLTYHDTEWGVPLHDDRRLFETLVLQGAQAGLSWLTILKKRQNYRAAFDCFEPDQVAAYDADRVAALLLDRGIVRNRLKIEAAVANAQAFLQIQHEYGSFDAFIWGLVGNRIKKNAWRHLGEIPAQTKESGMMSRELKKRGFRFVGPTICYAFMQAVGMVNDHLITCFRHHQVS